MPRIFSDLEPSEKFRLAAATAFGTLFYAGLIFGVFKLVQAIF